MPWSRNDYPDSMKNLPEDVRSKAIEIGNALLEEDYEEGRAISIAIAKARDFVEGSSENRTEYHLKPDGSDWVLEKRGSRSAIFKDSTKENVLDKARDYVNEHEGVLVIHRLDGSVSDRLYD